MCAYTQLANANVNVLEWTLLDHTVVLNQTHDRPNAFTCRCSRIHAYSRPFINLLCGASLILDFLFWTRPQRTSENYGRGLPHKVTDA